MFVGADELVAILADGHWTRQRGGVAAFAVVIEGIIGAALGVVLIDDLDQDVGRDMHRGRLGRFGIEIGLECSMAAQRPGHRVNPDGIGREKLDDRVMLERIDMDMERGYEPGAGLLDGETFGFGHSLPRDWLRGFKRAHSCRQAVIPIVAGVNPIAESNFD